MSRRGSEQAAGGDDPDAVSERAIEFMLQELAPEREAAPSYLFEWPRLARFILGNDHALPEAAAQFRRMLAWRREVGMEETRRELQGKPWHADSVPGLARVLQTMNVDAWTHLDDGELLWLQFDGRLSFEALRAVPEAELFQALHGMCELRETHLDELSKQQGRLIRTVQVRNLWGLSIPRLVKDRGTMGRLQRAMKTLPVAFPETVSKIVILNVPSAFNMFWSIVSPRFHPRMRRKLHFLGSDFLEDLARVVGTRGLEAIFRAWHSGATEREVEVGAGAKEHACCRLADGEVGEWSFGVGPENVSGGLQFSVAFVCDGSARVEVLQAPTLQAGRVQGSHRAKTSGLLCLIWSNPSGWATRATARRVTDLQLGAQLPAAVPDRDQAHVRTPAKLAEDERRRLSQCGVGCFPLLALFGRSGARAVADAQQREGAREGAPSGPPAGAPAACSRACTPRPPPQARRPQMCLSPATGGDADVVSGRFGLGAVAAQDLTFKVALVLLLLALLLRSCSVSPGALPHE